MSRNGSQQIENWNSRRSRSSAVRVCLCSVYVCLRYYVLKKTLLLLLLLLRYTITNALFCSFSFPFFSSVSPPLII